MIPSFARVLTTTIYALAFALTLVAQTPTPTPKPTGSVSGRITIKDKGVAGVMVILRRTEVFNPFDVPLRTVSDQEGNYRVTEVPPGTYELFVITLAYVHANSANARGRTIIVSEGESIDNIDFSLVRGGVITGKITDADGRPLIQHQVKLFREFDNPRPPVQNDPPIATEITDDRGIYRAYGLIAGRYKVSSGRGENSAVANNFGGSAIFNEVFYPDVVERSKGGIIEVSEGSEASNINIQLGRAIQTFSVSGRTVDSEKGEPLPNVRLALQKLVGDRNEPMASFVVTNGSGNFSLDGLGPGKYSVYTMPEPNTATRAEANSFDVIDSDVTGVTVRIGKGASISGVVFLENDNREAVSRLQKVLLMALVMNPATSMGMGQISRSTIGPDGSFHIGGLPGGVANIRLTSMGDPTAPKGFVVTRVERDGVVQPKGIELKEGEQVSGVRVVINFGNGILRGVVNFQNGTLPPEAQTFVRVTRAGEQNPAISSARVDNRGRFVIENLPAGSYDVWVFASGVRTAPTKQAVVLQDGATADVTVTIDLGEKPKP